MRKCSPLSHHIAVCWLEVFYSRKPPQTVLVNIHSKRVTRRHKNIYAEVKFESINKERLEVDMCIVRLLSQTPTVWTDLWDVLLDYTVISCLDISAVFENKDPPSLTTTFRFGNEGYVFLTSTIRLEFTKTEEDKYLLYLTWWGSLTYSAGRHHDRGKILYSLGKIFNILFILRAKRSFRHISIIPGKWLIFCAKT